MDTAIDHARRLMDGFGRHLRATRKHYGVSLRDVGEDTGIRADILTRIETAQAIPTVEIQETLRDWLLQHPLPD